MALKQILNNTLRPFNLKGRDGTTGVFNVMLAPGLNEVDAPLHKALAALAFCKSRVDEGDLDFNPSRVKKGTPVSVPNARSIEDPAVERGSKAKGKAKSKAKGKAKTKKQKEEAAAALADEDYQGYLAEVTGDELAMSYDEWLEADDEDEE